MREDPKSPQKTDCLTEFFAPFGSAHLKGAHKMLVESTLGRQTNFKESKLIYRAHHGFKQAKLDFGDLVVGLSQFLILL